MIKNTHILFMGINNKPHLKPLDSGTITGKTVDQIAFAFPSTEKSNLCPFNISGKYPDKNEIIKGLSINADIVDRSDIIVCLGNIVYNSMKHISGKTIIKIKHPASIWGNKKKYIEDSINKIKLAVGI